MERASTDPFVPNDLVLGDRRRMLIITGPNMGGKSTYMRQTALIAILAHIGSFVPAVEARIGPVDRIFTRVGASDDLSGGRSTFMVEMTETANILNNATASSLVLMDEVGRGTSTFDGLSLAWAAARHIARESRAFTLFATHYFELTSLPEQLPDCANVHLDAAEHGDELIFLHAVKEGPANQSYGLQVARLAGVPARVVADARHYLAALEAREHGSGDHPQVELPLQRSEPEAAPVEEDPIRLRLREVDPDSLTPRQALELLYDLAASREGKRIIVAARRALCHAIEFCLGEGSNRRCSLPPRALTHSLLLAFAARLATCAVLVVPPGSAQPLQRLAIGPRGDPFDRLLQAHPPIGDMFVRIERDAARFR